MLKNKKRKKKSSNKILQQAFKIHEIGKFYAGNISLLKLFSFHFVVHSILYVNINVKKRQVSLYFNCP